MTHSNGIAEKSHEQLWRGTEQRHDATAWNSQGLLGLEVQWQRLATMRTAIVGNRIE